MAAEDWQVDAVVTGLRRAYPEAMSKGQLSDWTDLPPEELRAVIEHLLEEGSITEAGSAGPTAGWRWLEVDERPIGGAVVEEEPAVEEVHDEEPADDEAEPAAQGAVAAGQTPYGLRLSMSATFFPDGGGDPDEEAMLEAEKVRAALAEAFEPYMRAEVKVVEVVAFDAPRRLG